MKWNQMGWNGWDEMESDGMQWEWGGMDEVGWDVCDQTHGI